MNFYDFYQYINKNTNGQRCILETMKNQMDNPLRDGGRIEVQVDMEK